jgi:hypothetical protein
MRTALGIVLASILFAPTWVKAESVRYEQFRNGHRVEDTQLHYADEIGSFEGKLFGQQSKVDNIQLKDGSWIVNFVDTDHHLTTVISVSANEGPYYHLLPGKKRTSPLRTGSNARGVMFMTYVRDTPNGRLYLDETAIDVGSAVAQRCDVLVDSRNRINLQQCVGPAGATLLKRIQ